MRLLCTILLLAFFAVPAFSEQSTSTYAFTELTSLKEKAEQGDAEAQNRLGFRYAGGEGVPQDALEAIKWYRKAADQGNATAQCNLGLAYASGEGVTKNDAEAAKWYLKSAEQGDASAQILLGDLYATGAGVSQDDAEAAKWYRKAAEQGEALGQAKLGNLYYYGHGVPHDNEKAYFWLILASTSDYTLTSWVPRGLESSLAQQQVSAIQKRVSEWKPVRDQPPTSDSSSTGSNSRAVGLFNLWRGDPSAFGFVIALSFLVTWGLGLAPALIARYLVYKQPLPRERANWIAGIACVAFAVIFWVWNDFEGHKSSPVTWLLVFFVSRWLMTRIPKAP